MDELIKEDFHLKFIHGNLYESTQSILHSKMTLPHTVKFQHKIILGTEAKMTLCGIKNLVF